MSLSIQAYIGDSYTFFLQISDQATVSDLKMQIEANVNQFFRSDTLDRIIIFSLADMSFSDLPPGYPACQLFQNQAPVICYLNLGDIQSMQFVLHEISPKSDTQIVTAMRSNLTDEQKQQILNQPITPFPQQPLPLPQPQHKCVPYCLPLAKKGAAERCACGEVKSYAVSDSQYCTEHCRTAEQRKMKASGMDFCSICMSRYRNSKYVRGQPHECKICDRPWLLLNSEGICRSCHCEMQTSAGGRQIPFRQAEYENTEKPQEKDYEKAKVDEK